MSNDQSLFCYGTDSCAIGFLFLFGIRAWLIFSAHSLHPSIIRTDYVGGKNQI